MKYYHSYINRQEISQEAHGKLLTLEVMRRPSRARAKYGALAACAVLAIGIGVWKLAPTSTPELAQPGAQEPGPIQVDAAQPPLLQLDYGKAGQRSGVSYSIALPEGSFFRDLSKEDLISLFGEEDLLYTQLGWEDAELSSCCIFTAEGMPWEGTVTVRRITGGADDFYAVLTLAPDTLPLSCVVSPSDGVTQCWGVEVTGRYGGTYGEGSNKDIWLPESREVEFMAHGVGYRLCIYGQEGEGAQVEEMVSRFVRYAIVDGDMDLSCLTVEPKDIPAWREETFSSLAQARQEAEFAPYLPTSEPAGYDEFYSNLSYQEGIRNGLFVRWSRGYDSVEVCVYRDGTRPYHLADPDNPASYDLRLYPIPWCGSVPEEYWDTVNDPAFRAEDMSLEIVEARGREHDTGGMTYSFDVLHPDGVLVSYRCDGMTAQQVWALAADTL